MSELAQLVDKGSWEIVQKENPELAAAIKDLVDKGQTHKQIRAFLTEKGYNGMAVMMAVNAAAYLESQKQSGQITEQELIAKLNALGDLTDTQRREIVCALIGHSKIQTACFGYFNCARCQAQVGDTLGSVYPQAEKVVIVGHNCEKCRENYDALGWEDKFMCPDPFADDVE